MTTSRSIASRNSGVALALAVAVVTLVAGTTAAEAAPRRRVVVLDFKGPEASKFHADVISLVKKSHTVVSIDKWDRAADDLGAAKLSSKNVQKVARKLNVDGVIVGEVEKRRDRYILRLKIREGRTGDYTGNPIEATSGKGWLDARATKDVKGELLDTIETLDPPRSSEDEEDDRGRSRSRDREAEEDEDDRGSSRSRSRDRDREEEEETGRDRDRGNGSGFSGKSGKRGRDQVGSRGRDRAMEDEEEDVEDDRPPPRSGKAGKAGGRAVAKGRARDDGDGDDEENPLARRSGKGMSDDDRDLIRSKQPNRDEEDEDAERSRDGDDGDDEDGDRVAAKDDEDADADADAEVEERAEVDDGVDRTSPGERGVDAVLGLSVWRRRLAFSAESDLMDKPQGYRGSPVAGLYFDADIYPLVFTKNRSILRGLGVTVLVDRVLKITSEINFMGMTEALATKQYRYGAGVIFRYPFNSSPTSPVIAARVRYSKMAFSIDRSNAPAGAVVDVPNVGYTIVDPGLIFTLPIGTKVSLSAEVAFAAMLKTGAISEGDNYGQGTVTAIDGELNGDYRFTRHVFARLAFKVLTVGYKFNGTGNMTTDRDADTDQDVFGARDTYLGGFVSAGYLF